MDAERAAHYNDIREHPDEIRRMLEEMRRDMHEMFEQLRRDLGSRTDSSTFSERPRRYGATERERVYAACRKKQGPDDDPARRWNEEFDHEEFDASTDTDADAAEPFSGDLSSPDQC